jgi:hypothetical protein
MIERPDQTFAADCVLCPFACTPKVPVFSHNIVRLTTAHTWTKRSYTALQVRPTGFPRTLLY